MKETVKLIKVIVSLLLISTIIFGCSSSKTPADADISGPGVITVDCASDGGTVNPDAWAVGSPDKYMWWPGNAVLQQRISDAKIRLVRTNPIQLLLYHSKDPYPSHNTWNWTDMDSALNTIFNAGAQPIFTLCKFPAGVPHTFDTDGKTITSADWNEYGNFMAGVVKHYNVDKALGSTRTIKYWEMWNEPSIEGDGKFATQADYKSFVTAVGNAMKAQDPTIKLIGPVAPSTDLSPSGWVAYTAQNMKSQIDILCWHDYGPDPSNTDEDRMAWTEPHYQNNIITGRTGFGSFGAAITEYNMSWQDGGSTYNAKYHNEFGATFVASAIINAMKGKADIFSYYCLSETGKNLLGLLSNTDFSPYKPYYTFYLFGNFTGNQILTATGGTSNIEYYATKDTATGKYYITVVNKDTNHTTVNITISLKSISGTTGAVNVRKVDAGNNPTSYSTMSYSASKFTYAVAPYSVINFEVAPGG